MQIENIIVNHKHNSVKFVVQSHLLFGLPFWCFKLAQKFEWLCVIVDEVFRSRGCHRICSVAFKGNCLSIIILCSSLSFMPCLSYSALIMVGHVGKEESLVVEAICYVASLFVGIHTHLKLHDLFYFMKTLVLNYKNGT